MRFRQRVGSLQLAQVFDHLIDADNVVEDIAKVRAPRTIWQTLGAAELRAKLDQVLAAARSSPSNHT